MDLDGVQAAIRAGYSEKTASSAASRLLKDVRIQNALQEALKEQEKRTHIDHDWVINELVGIIEQGRAAVEVLTKDGEPTGEYIANLPAANKALELLGKHLRMFSEGPAVQINNDNRQVIMRVVYDDDGNQNPFTINSPPSSPEIVDSTSGETEDSPLR